MKLGLVLMGRAMLSISLIQFSVEGWGCVLSLLFTWGQTMVEVMRIMVTSLKWSQDVLLQSPTLQLATTDPHLHWRLLDTHRPVSCGVTVPFSWVLVHKFLLCPPRVYFPALCKFWQLCSGVNGDLLQEGLCHTYPHQEPLSLRQTTADQYLHRTRWNSSVSVSVGFLGPGAHKVCLSLLSLSGRNKVWF